MTEIPQHIDEPPQFLFWYMDEVVAMSIAFVLGILTNHLTYGLIGAYFMAKISRKFREGNQVNYMQHLLYWKGAYPLNAHTVINPFIRVLC